jgi:membrane protease YdiL (CAAX protease family)
MEPSSALEPVRADQHGRLLAVSHGTDVSTWGVLAVVALVTGLTYQLTWATPGGPSIGAARWFVAGEVAKLALWLSVLGLFGWRRAGGLAMTSGSARTIVPLAAVSLVTVVLAARGGSPGYELPLVAGLFLGALREEIAFRGFVLHGLARRLGATSSILGTSMLFAAYHLPRYLREERAPAEMAALLLVAFGVSVFLCRVRIETGSIWLPAIIHRLWNVLVDVGQWAFPQGELPGAYVALHTVPFALGIVMALLLVVPGVLALGGAGDLHRVAGLEGSGRSGVATLRRRSSG